MEVEKKKKSGSRLFQLAINDAIQSHLSLVSPVRILMEKEKMEKRKSMSMKSKAESFLTDTFEKKYNSVSSDKFFLKNWKKTNDSDSGNVLTKENSSVFSNNAKNCQVRNISHSGKTLNLADLESGEENLHPKSRRSSLLEDFECLWIPDENSNSSDISNNSLSIDLNSPEWNKIESKCVSLRDSSSETSIDYDLPVFPQTIDSESILSEEPLQPKSFYIDSFSSKIPNLTSDSLINSSEPPLQTPGIEFLQQSVVFNNFIPPPKVVKERNSLSDAGIPAPYMHKKRISTSHKSLNSSKRVSEEFLRMYGSEATLSGVNNENSLGGSNSLKFNQYLTLHKHFKSMLPGNISESFENTVEPTLSGSYPYNSHIQCPISKPYPVNDRISGDSYESPYKSNSNFHHLKKSCYGNPSGLLEHFPDFKPVM